MKFKASKIILVACSVLWLLIAIFALFVLHPILVSIVESTVVMGPDTYEFWGQNPGESQTVTSRNMTFYSFTNPRGFIYKGEQPNFREVSGYAIQELSNFTDYHYSHNKEEVFYNYWLHFEELSGSRSLDEKVEILNIIPLGFWAQIGSANLSTFALQGYGGLFIEMNATIISQAIGQGIAAVFYSNKANFQGHCFNLELSQSLCNYLWEDPVYGLQAGSTIWVDFSLGNKKSSERLLTQYFSLTAAETASLKSTFTTWCETLNSLLNNWYCEGKQCSSYDLTLQQLSSGGVTLNPPVGDAVPSICSSGNSTCVGDPQISTFLKDQFKKNHPDPLYQKLQFSVQTFKALMTPYRGTLLNPGNLSHLFQIGSAFDQAETNSTESKQLLGKIQQLTHAETTDHAFVIWEWVKYFANEFVLKQKYGGDRKVAALAGLFSQSLYESMTTFGYWANRQLLGFLTKSMVQDCASYVKKIVSDIDTQKANKICSKVKENNFSTYYDLISPCFAIEDDQQQFRNNSNLSFLQMAEYCDETQESMLTLGNQAFQAIHKHYGCDMNSHEQRCSDYEIGLIQWVSSNITRNSIDKSVFPASLTGHNWNPQLAEFEYQHYLDVVGKQDPQNHNNKTQLLSLLSFTGLFSVPGTMDLILLTDQEKFSSQYFWNDMELFKSYIKFVTIEVGFGGITTKRTVRELLFGYEDEFLKTAKMMDIMLGGDPSLQTTVMFNEPNLTLQEAYLYPQSMNTGLVDVTKTRQYMSVNNKPYITYNKTWFDGYDIYSEFVSPYKNQVKLKGTDSILNKPDLSKDDPIVAYITTLFRYGSLHFQKEVDKFGLTTYEYRLDTSFLASSRDFADNAVYYQGYDGFVNMSFQGGPVFISRNHFYKAPSNWSKLIDIYDETGKHQVHANPYDDTYIITEPLTGASFSACIFLQTNFEFNSNETDILFAPSKRMLPVFSLFRSGNITEKASEDLFGPLKLGLDAKYKIFLTALAAQALILLIFLLLRRNEKQAIIKSSLLTEHELEA